jgi:hypothetical protein
MSRSATSAPRSGSGSARPPETVSGTQTYVVSFHLENVVNDIGDGTAEFYYDHVSTSNEYVYKAPPGDRQGTCGGHSCGVLLRRLVVRRPSAPRRRARRRPSPPRTSARRRREHPGVLSARRPSGTSSPTCARARRRTPPRRRCRRAVGTHARLPLLGGLGALLPVRAAGLMGVLVWTRGRDEDYAGLTAGLTPGADQTRRPHRAPLRTGDDRGAVQPAVRGSARDDGDDPRRGSQRRRRHGNSDRPRRARPPDPHRAGEDQRLASRRLGADASAQVRDRTPLAAYEQHLLDAVFAGATSCISTN